MQLHTHTGPCMQRHAKLMSESGYQLAPHRPWSTSGLIWRLNLEDRAASPLLLESESAAAESGSLTYLELPGRLNCYFIHIRHLVSMPV